MDRSNFYYDQEVREAELDQIYDDCQNADQDLVEMLCKSGGWGVLDGLELTPQGTPDLTLNVSAGTAYNANGERIYLASPTVIDFAPYVNPTNARRVRVEIETNRVESDPRLDGHSNPVNYRSAETATVSLSPGPADGSETVPARSAGKVSLGVVNLAAADTAIGSGTIYQFWYAENASDDPDPTWEPYRDLGGFLTRATHHDLDPPGANGRGVISFGADTDTRMYGLRVLAFLTEADGAGPDALDLRERNIFNVDDIRFDDGSGGNGYIQMGAVGNGGDIRFVDLLEFDATSTADPAIDMNGRSIGAVDELLFSSSGADPAINLNNRNIDGVDRITADAGGAGSWLDANGRASSLSGIIMAAGSYISCPGGGLNIATGDSGDAGGYVRTYGGNVETGSGGSGGGSVVTHGGAVNTNGGAINTNGGNIDTVNGDVYIGSGDFNTFSGVITAVSGLVTAGGGLITSGSDIDSDGGDIIARDGVFTYGTLHRRIQSLYISASDAMGDSSYWDLITNSSGAVYDRWFCTAVSANNDSLLFPIHIPPGAWIISIAAKIKSTVASGLTMRLMRNDPQFDSPASVPGGRGLVTGATAINSAGNNPSWETLQDVLSSPHQISSARQYFVAIDPSTTAEIVHSVEVVYRIEEVKAGLH